MKFKIISNQQTPKIENQKDIETLLAEDLSLLTKFLSFARIQHNCAGLASNQCSVGSKKKQERIMEPFFAMKKDRVWQLIVHPTIIKYNGKPIRHFEGCLTWLGKKMEVERHINIDVKYYNIKGELIEETLHDWDAIVFQHEYDHLNGVIENFVDKT